ncbi:MAG: hypothetical protein VX899_08870 [Myxococcota bacterium]|nr:hypothetical protein [Myxococcota bacterium]
MKLPSELRESLVIAVDDYLETVNDDPDASTLAAALMDLLEQAAEDADYDTEDIATEIEEEAELEEPLQDVLEYEFTKNDEIELTGEDVVNVVEKLIGILWHSDGMDEDPLDSYGDEEEEAEPSGF